MGEILIRFREFGFKFAETGSTGCARHVCYGALKVDYPRASSEVPEDNPACLRVKFSKSPAIGIAAAYEARRSYIY